MVTDLGNYETEIFEYEKNDLIKLAIFKENNYNIDDLGDMEPIIVKKGRYKEGKSLLKKKEIYRLIQFQEDFLDAIKARDTLKLIQQLSSDIVVCDSVYTRSKFFEICFPSLAERIDSHYVYKYPVKKPWSVLKRYGTSGFYQMNVESVSEFNQEKDSKYRKGAVYQDKIFITHQIYDHDPSLAHLNFIYVLRNGRYYLFGIDYLFMRDCCR